ncbi:MAG: metallopeptidase TldD-related protein [Burkholderiaceae bacterium]
MIREHFDTLADAVCQVASDNDQKRVTLNLSAEQSDFIRLNRARVRQATSVQQQNVTVSVIDGQRRASSTVSLPADQSTAQALLTKERDSLIELLPMVPEDPHLMLTDTIESTSREAPAGSLTPPGEVIAPLLAQAGNADLVGFYAAGPVTRAYADSRGQRNWHQIASFHLDWSLYSAGVAKDRAVKSSYAGQQFDASELSLRVHRAKEQLAWLERPAREVSPGAHRVWLAPAAVAELLQAMAWSGFSRKERSSGTSSLIKLANGETAMHQSVSMTESIARGIAPRFTASGHVRPDDVMLIDRGKPANTLVSPRSAAEFDESANAAASEYPEALEMSGGDIPTDQSLAALDTGLWIGNLWYLNYSDRQAARVTGMTRFACFQVENGAIVGPVGVMRFDDSLLNLFGDKLAGLSQEVEFIPGSSTWGEREINSVRCPGMLLSELKLTL